MDFQADNLMPSDADWTRARAVYRDFKRRPGSRAIATEFALAHMHALIHAIQPRRVLEIGAGIGTQTVLMLSHTTPPEHLVITEPNAFCISQLARNIPDQYADRVTLITAPDEISPRSTGSGNTSHPIFDLVVVDGTPTDLEVDCIEAQAAVFVEGNRRRHREHLAARLATRGLVVDFQNYHRGVKKVHLAWRPTSYGIKRPKLRFNHTLKGCWIGIVQQR